MGKELTKETKKNGMGLFPAKEQKFWKYVFLNMERIREIRIRVGKPILIYINRKEVSLDEEGNIIYVVEKGKRFSYTELQELVDYWCMESRYAFQDEIKRGYLTILGGHRIGICGEIVEDSEGNIKTIKYISGVNIRIAHEVKGAAKNIMSYLYKEDQIVNSIIISPPGGGKTTLLRDLIRRISDGNQYNRGKNVGIVDERGEIAACFQGIPQLDIGIRSDVLDNCQKKWGMNMLLRAMAPEVIAIDELGNKEEIELIHYMYGCGCSVLATVHGNSLEEIKSKKIFQSIWDEEIFQNIILLHHTESKYHLELYRNGENGICCMC